MRRNRGAAVIAVAVAQAAGVVLAPASAAATTEVVGNGSAGWAFDEQVCGSGSQTGTHGFEAGPGTPPAGTGSVQFTTGANGASYQMLRTTNYGGTALSAISSLGYSTHVGANNGAQAPFLVLVVDTTGTTDAADDALFFEPYYQAPPTHNPSIPSQGPLTTGSWQSWDARHGGWWSNNDPMVTPGSGVKTLDFYLSRHPSARIVNFDSGGAPTAGGLSIRAGCGTPSWDDFIGNADTLTVGVSGDDTAYDLELCTHVSIEETGELFCSIQEAVDAAAPGQTILVGPGTYNESVFVGKSLTLLGAKAGQDARTRATTGESVINGPCGPLQLAGANITVDGFTIQGSTMAGACFIAGIWTNPLYLANEGGFTILNNIVRSNIFGLQLNGGGNPSLIRFNVIEGNTNAGPGSGSGMSNVVALELSTDTAGIVVDARLNDWGVYDARLVRARVLDRGTGNRVDQVPFLTGGSGLPVSP